MGFLTKHLASASETWWNAEATGGFSIFLCIGQHVKHAVEELQRLMFIVERQGNSGRLQCLGDVILSGGAQSCQKFLIGHSFDGYSKC